MLHNLLDPHVKCSIFDGGIIWKPTGISIELVLFNIEMPQFPRGSLGKGWHYLILLESL